jgi:hypothetical protein
MENFECIIRVGSEETRAPDLETVRKWYSERRIPADAIVWTAPWTEWKSVKSILVPEEARTPAGTPAAGVPDNLIAFSVIVPLLAVVSASEFANMSTLGAVAILIFAVLTCLIPVGFALKERRRISIRTLIPIGTTFLAALISSPFGEAASGTHGSPRLASSALSNASQASPPADPVLRLVQIIPKTGDFLRRDNDLFDQSWTVTAILKNRSEKSITDLHVQVTVYDPAGVQLVEDDDVHVELQQGSAALEPGQFAAFSLPITLRGTSQEIAGRYSDMQNLKLELRARGNGHKLAFAVEESWAPQLVNTDAVILSYP